MSNLFIEYPRCTTCKKAKKWLEENNITFQQRDIVGNKPSKDELKKWYEKSGLPIKKFFNTSGVLYKEMGLKDKLSDMTEDEQLTLLSTDGKLVKRPIVVNEDFILVGFKEDEWIKLKQ